MIYSLTRRRKQRLCPTPRWATGEHNAIWRSGSCRSSNLKEHAMSDERKYQKRVLITGGTGFIGSCLAMELLNRSDDVAVILADRNPDRRRLTGFSQHFDRVKDR